MIQFSVKKKKKIASGPLKYLIMLTAISGHLTSLEETGFIPEMNVKYKFKSIFKQYFSQALNKVLFAAKLKAGTQLEYGGKCRLWIHRRSSHTEETGAGLAVS